MWAVYERGHVPHLGNHTNNRLECAWGNLKEILRPEIELDECVETLHFLQSTAELEYASRFHVIGTRHYHGADDILMRLSALVSAHAFNLIRKEYDLFKSETVLYDGRWLQEGIVQLRSQTTEKEYVINVSDFTRSCFFMRTMLLPCHHTMFVRSNLKKKKVIPINYIHSRWLLQSKANRPDEDESDDDVSCSAFRILDSHMRSSKHAVLNGSTKWRTGMDIAQRVVEDMSSQGTSTFLGLLKALRTFGEYAAQGAVPTIEASTPKDDNDANNDGNFDHQPNDETPVSPSLKTEDTKDTSADGNCSDDSRVSANDGDSPVSSNSTKQNGSLVNKSNELVKNELTLVKPSNELVKNGKRLVKTTNHLVKSPGTLVVRKRGSDDKASGGESDVSSTSEEERRMFEIIRSTSSKGRPKIRKKQQREAKRLRMEDSTQQANALVQGTLVPVKDLALVRKTLECSFNVTDALPVLLSITPVDAPAWKSTSIVQIARKRKVQRQVTIVFPKHYLVKCIAGIKTYRKSLPEKHDAGKMGVTIAKHGTFTERDLVTLNNWRDEMPKLEAFSDLASWIRLSKFSRLTLPPSLNNCINVDMKACATRLETVNLRTTVGYLFGRIAVHDIASFRRSQWLDDACIMLVLSHLVEKDRAAHPRVGVGAVNPLFMRMSDDDVKRDMIEASLPCQRGNNVVLVSIHLEAHWAGIVFNYNDNKLVFFDPMQSKANYDLMEVAVNEYFGENLSGLDKTRQRAPRQQDTTSCGPLTLLFFECMTLGIPVPSASET